MVRRVVEVFGKFWQSGGFDHPSDPDLITCCRLLTSWVRIPHAVNVLRQTLKTFLLLLLWRNWLAHSTVINAFIEV